jgi:hypothetical protein
LADAIEQLDPKKLGWIQTTFWQRADLQGLTFQAEGRYVAAPENRRHLALKVQLGGTPGFLELVSDGTTLWDAVKIADKPQAVTKTELTKALEGLKGVKEAETVRDEYFRNQSFSGVAPLLVGIQQRMAVTHKEAVRRDGRDMIRLTAVWVPELARSLTDAARAQGLPDGSWPPNLARTCYLYLETVGPQKLLWPARLEWWGPAQTSQRGSDHLLLAMEFRNPRLNQPLPADQIAREFKFTPAKNAQTRDITKETSEGVKQMAMQLAAQKKGATPSGTPAKPEPAPVK